MHPLYLSSKGHSVSDILVAVVPLFITSGGVRVENLNVGSILSILDFGDPERLFCVLRIQVLVVHLLVLFVGVSTCQVSVLGLSWLEILFWVELLIVLLVLLYVCSSLIVLVCHYFGGS